MSHEVKVHATQISILRELLFVPDAGYSELQKPTGLTSDHFNFHIGRLVELGLVEKLARGRYSLSIKGKEYANKLDTDEKTVERQPKVAVILVVERTHDGERQLLFQERLKNPYYGYWGFPTGKIRWGETILDTAARELKEETNLIADHQILGLYHEHAVLEETEELLEDKMFFVVQCLNSRGELVANFEGGRNKWMSLTEARAMTKKFASLDAELEIVEGGGDHFVELRQVVPKSEF